MKRGTTSGEIEQLREPFSDALVRHSLEEATKNPGGAPPPADWLGHREERAKCLEKLYQGLQAELAAKRCRGADSLKGSMAADSWRAFPTMVMVRRL